VADLDVDRVSGLSRDPCASRSRHLSDTGENSHQSERHNPGKHHSARTQHDANVPRSLRPRIGATTDPAHAELLPPSHDTEIEDAGLRECSTMTPDGWTLTSVARLCDPRPASAGGAPLGASGAQSTNPKGESAMSKVSSRKGRVGHAVHRR
jgi:hypothetical protein